MMKKILIRLWILVLCLGYVQMSRGQESLPVSPYKILKSFTYDKLIAERGEGIEIIDTLAGQAYLAGIQYPETLLGLKGTLDYFFTGDSVSRMVFRYNHPVPPPEPQIADRIVRDTAFRNLFTRQTLERDSLRRDTLIRGLSEILGPPVASGKTAPSERNARFSTSWINHGYSCIFRDYVDYGEIVFTLPNASAWIRGEFDIDPATEIVQRSVQMYKKERMTVTLMAQPDPESNIRYIHYFLLLEFGNGQRFVENLPDMDPGYLPKLKFDDTNGTGTLDAWVSIPMSPDGGSTREFIYSLQFREPILVFNSLDYLPESVQLQPGRKIVITGTDGTRQELAVGTNDPWGVLFNSSGEPQFAFEKTPAGFHEFFSEPRNRDGTLNFTGHMSLNAGMKHTAVLKMRFKHSMGGWEPAQYSTGELK